jgi:beta-alanine degradation protein BauB
MRKQVKMSTLIVMAIAIIGSVVAAVWAQDPTKVAPDIYKTIFENDRVRVNEVNLKVGAHIDFHVHPDHVIYWVQAGTVRIYNKGADSVDVTGTVGQAMFIPSCTHAATNVGKTDIRLAQVELKEPVPAKPAAAEKK